MLEKLYLVIPAYNEEMNIERVVCDWYPVTESFGKDSRIVVIDDGSKDATYDILLKLAIRKPNLIPLRKQNGGHGSAVLYGYYYAIESGADFIFQTDSDGQTCPSEFIEFWEKRDKNRMVIGNRWKRGDGMSRIFVTKVLKICIRSIFGVWVKDANTPYRLMGSSALKKSLEIIPENYDLPNIILSIIYIKKGEALFLPITFKTRQKGKNSLTFIKIVKIGIKALGDFKDINERIEEINFDI